MGITLWLMVIIAVLAAALFLASMMLGREIGKCMDQIEGRPPDVA